MPGPRNEFEEHLIEVADGDPGFLDDASELLGYHLEEPPVAVVCPRCGRTLTEDEEDKMVPSAAAGGTDIRICWDCECAEESRMLHGFDLQPPAAWPLPPRR